MSAITDYARGKPCFIMLPGYPHLPETTVYCHLRMAGITGTGLKSSDLHGAFGCYDCHRVTEGDQLTAEEKLIDREWLDLVFLQAIIKTQAYILRHKPELIVKLARAAA